MRYAGLPGDKYYELARKYLPQGCCGVVSFGVKGGRAAAGVAPDLVRFSVGLEDLKDLIADLEQALEEV